MAAPYTYLALYMIGFFTISIPTISVGSLIPFMASELQVNETEYSIIFLVMSMATLTAALAYKLLGKFELFPKYHTIPIISSLSPLIVAFLE